LVSPCLLQDTPPLAALGASVFESLGRRVTASLSSFRPACSRTRRPSLRSAPPPR
jgi:hypothetical protein